MLHTLVKIIFPLLAGCLMPLSIINQQHQLLAQDFQDIVNCINTKVKTEAELYQNELKTSRSKLEVLVQTDVDIIKQVLATNRSTSFMQNPGPQLIEQNSCSMEETEGLWIFVSHSMPKGLIAKYAKVADKIGAKLVIRGLKNNSFKETISYLKGIQNQGLKIAVHPQVFAKFKVNLVPSFVLSNNKQYDKLTGNVSIAYVLKQFAESGETAKEAQKYLQLLEGDND